MRALFHLFRMEHKCVVCNVVAALFAILVAGPITWWAIDRTPAYSVVEAGHAEPNPIKVGQPLDLVRVIMVYREGCDGWFNREIKDQSGYVWTFPITQSTFVPFKLGHYVTHSVTPFIVPRGVAEGEATVTSNIWSVCNPVQKLFPVYQRAPSVKVIIERDHNDSSK